MWHVSSRSGVATLRTAIHLLLTYLLTYLLTMDVLSAFISVVCHSDRLFHVSEYRITRVYLARRARCVEAALDCRPRTTTSRTGRRPSGSPRNVSPSETTSCANHPPPQGPPRPTTTAPPPGPTARRRAPAASVRRELGVLAWPACAAHSTELTTDHQMTTPNPQTTWLPSTLASLMH